MDEVILRLYKYVGEEKSELHTFPGVVIRVEEGKVTVIAPPESDINYILNLIKSVIEPHKITSLDLEECYIRELPDLTEFINLNRLEMVNCQTEKINYLPPSIKYLDISKNRLKTLPNIDKVHILYCDIETMIESSKINKKTKVIVHKDDDYFLYKNMNKKIYYN